MSGTLRLLSGSCFLMQLPRACLWGGTAGGGDRLRARRSPQPSEEDSHPHRSRFNKMWHVAWQPEHHGAFFYLLHQKALYQLLGDHSGWSRRQTWLCQPTFCFNFHASACILILAVVSVLICISLKGKRPNQEGDSLLKACCFY